MTNQEIIFNESVELMNKGIIGTTGRKILVKYDKVNEEGEKIKVEEVIDEPEPIHTFADWKSKGYFVNKGEKAIARFTIWNYTNGKKGKAAQEEEEGLVKSGYYYMKEACFFKLSQTTAAVKMLPAVV
jgi:hypothetical protein